MIKNFKTQNSLASSTAVDVLDNILFTLGNDRDGVMVLRSATLSADEELTDVIKGTSVHPATAANSLLISNITNDGDILLLASDGGNSKACLFFDASAPDTYLYNVGGTWTAGATTWQIPAVTLGGTVTVNGQAFDAGSGDVAITTTGNIKGLTITNTTGGVEGAAIQLYTNSADPANNDVIGTIYFYGEDSADNKEFYGQITCYITTVTSTSEASNYDFWLATGGGSNKAMTLTGAGLLSTDAAGAGDSLPTLFDEYDDAIELWEGVRESNRERLVQIGVMSKNKEASSGYMLHHQPMLNLLAGAGYQTRMLVEVIAKRLDMDIPSLLKEAGIPMGTNLLKEGRN